MHLPSGLTKAQIRSKKKASKVSRKHDQQQERMEFETHMCF
ncbi:hypothetical protein GCWU000325_00852 [Alloprevotella tannerae ATCC 51259]|uniref:Uncharacterized protein n=1 Tax=Alloprevotella tannerae ATCC 51259 TaxID=626522 RepID=C9LF70_9BACT|nr:hypothetical protein GCWU000325_00852 [Alloprevotella tannerae ATCC 51259]